LRFHVRSVKAKRFPAFQKGLKNARAFARKSAELNLKDIDCEEKSPPLEGVGGRTGALLKILYVMILYCFFGYFYPKIACSGFINPSV